MLVNEKSPLCKIRNLCLAKKGKTLFFYIRTSLLRTSYSNRKWTRDGGHFKSLSSDVFERRASTANGFFWTLKPWFLAQFWADRLNVVVSGRIEREKGSLPVEVRRLNEAVTMCEDRVRIHSRSRSRIIWKTRVTAPAKTDANEDGKESQLLPRNCCKTLHSTGVAGKLWIS